MMEEKLRAIELAEEHLAKATDETGILAAFVEGKAADVIIALTHEQAVQVVACTIVQCGISLSELLVVMKTHKTNGKTPTKP